MADPPAPRPLLMCDEATSSVDTQTDATIQQVPKDA
jgi:ABC-type multidrug transport system fused ATPase/permease subunit